MGFLIFTIVALALGQTLADDQTETCSSSYPPKPIIFFGDPEVERAAVTRSIGYIGREFTQFFDDFCEDIYPRIYRTIDGSCNNAQNLGTAHTPVRRLLPNDYDDKVNCPRQTAVDGSTLPSAREVSQMVHPAERDMLLLTHMLMQWGQFLDHDIAAFPVASEFESPFKCCGQNNTDPPFLRNKFCFPIELPADEPHFLGTCMEFARSVPAADQFGRFLSPREQINSLTAFIDASQIYGSSEERLALLRDDDGISLKTRGDNFLSESENEEDCILRPHSDDYCFVSGDKRVNEQPGLAALHTIFNREHNRLAKELRQIRPDDSNEEIFQLTRKIVGALIQKITYNDWLPLVLGTVSRTAGLTSRRGRSFYNPAIDPRIINAFSTAAFRFGHSLIPPEFNIGDRKVPLRELFNRPAEVLDNLEALLEGLSGLTSGDQDFQVEKVDRNFVTEVTEFLFQSPDRAEGLGLDLVALNIQRGRDHGLPGYTAWRNFCGLRNLTGFDDEEALGDFVSELGKVYSSVDDIDLFTGLVHEPSQRGLGIVGPTLSCLLSLQFSNLKYGDRFFFDTNDKRLGFSNGQLASIRGTDLGDVICANTDIKRLPENVFRRVTPIHHKRRRRGRRFNPFRRCSKRQHTVDVNKFSYAVEGSD